MLSFPASESKKETLALIQECSVENLSSIKKKNKKETNITEKIINKNVIQILEVSKGVIYEGELNDGKRHGKGKQKWKEGTMS